MISSKGVQIDMVNTVLIFGLLRTAVSLSIIVVCATKNCNFVVEETRDILRIENVCIFGTLLAIDNFLLLR